MLPELEVPFTIMIDHRERAPYGFFDLKADAKHKCRPLIVRYEMKHLPTGDYSIFGLEDEIAIERKSLADLFGTLSNSERRERFRREVIRLTEMRRAAIIVESSIEAMFANPPANSKLNPKSVYRTMIRWTARYGVPWIFADNRRLAEVTTFRLLEAYWETRDDAST